MCFGYYYDAPNLVKDPTKCRYDVGFYFAPKDEADREAIIAKMARCGYKYARMDDANCIYGKWSI